MNLDENKFPRAAKFFREHPWMTIDEAITYLEKQTPN